MEAGREVEEGLGELREEDKRGEGGGKRREGVIEGVT